MKNYIALFEEFEEGYDDFRQTLDIEYDDFRQAPDAKSDPFYQTISKDLIKLASNYTNEPVEIDQYANKYKTATGIKDLQNDLITKIYDEFGEDIAQSFADESDALLASLNISEKKKGLWDNINAKRKRGEKPAKPGEKGYPAPGALKSAQKTEESMNKKKIFAKTNNIPNNGVLNGSKKDTNLETGKTPQSLNPRKTTR